MHNRHEVLDGLRVDEAEAVVNVMAGVANGGLRGMLATNAPPPTPRHRRPAADAFFAQLGGALPVATEAAFDVFSTLTGTLTTHYAYLAAS